MPETHTIAARCIEDATFAREVLDGDDYPEVRAAIIADALEGAEVTGYFNPQPEPPGRASDLITFDRVSSMWSQISLPNLTSLATP